MRTEEEKEWLRLHLTPGLGRVGLTRLMSAFGSLEAIWKASPSQWQKYAGIQPRVAQARLSIDDPRLDEALQSLDNADARIITLLDQEHYPHPLRAIHDPPALLYVRGKLPPAPALAVVGSRSASEPTRRLTEEVSAELASRGIAIISGLARGIDASAHRGALAAKGYTLGVLGCGIDRIYPPDNTRLFHEILQDGGVISEYAPGTPPHPGHFPARNRIISGLSQGVLVAEASQKSGSLITVEFALEQGREVFAFPGALFADGGRGVNQLIKEGAHPVTEARDILEQLWPHLPSRQVQAKQTAFIDSISGDTRELYLHLSEVPRHPDELARKSGLTPMEVSDILLHLELLGGVEQLPGMRYVRSRSR